ncbi:MAG: hypothetical protein ABSB19_08190 [Methylomonas sp.]|jgi:hypothetical protein
MYKNYDQVYKVSEKLNNAIHIKYRFPVNVFTSSWNEFLFFDSDWIFEKEFIALTKNLIEIEGSVCAYIFNLDEMLAHIDMERSSFLINKETTEQWYQTFLQGANIGEGWIYGMDRFGIISDAAEWCIYSEKGNEIAVIAFHNHNFINKITSIIDMLGALPIKKAIDKPLSYGFTQRALSLEWRNQLLKAYSNNR